MAYTNSETKNMSRIFAFIQPTLSLEIALNKRIDGTPAKGWFGIMHGCSFSVRVDLQIPFMLIFSTVYKRWGTPTSYRGPHNLTFL